MAMTTVPPSPETLQAEAAASLDDARRHVHDAAKALDAAQDARGHLLATMATAAVDAVREHLAEGDEDYA